ncbi:MAG: beta-ketoacyl-[acyl-carrier-protein] synthase II, partial [Deltaproteobacteria bacterium]|nr:beta-ketoacyl-[acyl-carrier-protein] synthase II [Deltaproteobacteria bacterium]
GVGLSGSTDGVLRYDLSGDSIARAMSMAAEEPAGVNYISAAANSTPELDRAEASAIRKVFGERTKEIFVSSLKSMIGEFDGSGGIRACGLALSLYHGMIPPTIGTEHLDPQCDLNVVLGQSIRKEIRSALLNSCSNGGSNISVWFKRYA